ncbi:hypothetical protein AB1Y20_008823 [Prymnesium parvum]|uniref:RRM domain-containing protein n=1 Tax=Prymnesium parvum TaxID=97485 RepID=A0AB34IUI0_PRYPA
MPNDDTSVETEMKALTIDETPQEQKGSQPKPQGVKFFIGDIAPHTTEESLREHFKQFGSVERVVVKHPTDENHRSFAFVTIEGDTEKVTSTPHVIDGHAVSTPEIARNHGGKPAGRARGAKAATASALRKIFVGGLTHQTDEATLRAHFEQFGKLTDVVVMHEAGGSKPRGFGFVTFADSAAVDRVLASRFHPVDGRGVEVKLAIPREMMHREPEAKPYPPDSYYPYAEYGAYVPPAAMAYGYTPMSAPPLKAGPPAQGIRVLHGTAPSYAPKGEYAPPPRGSSPLPHAAPMAAPYHPHALPHHLPMHAMPYGGVAPVYAMGYGHAPPMYTMG